MLRVSKGYKDIQVECVSFTPDIGEQAVSAIGLTYHINDLSKLRAEGLRTLVDKIAGGKTNPKIMEAAKCSFIFKNISRVCLSRLTRDQCEAINSESQATPTFNESMELSSKHVARRATVPLNIVNDPELFAEYKGILDMIEAFQLKLEGADFAWAPDIRYIGTMGTQIDIFMQFNARQFIATCMRRFINSINDEDNYAYRKARHALAVKVASTTMSDLSRQLWHKVIADCDPKVDFTDELLGKEFDRGVSFIGDADKHIYNADQTAWAYELIRISKDEPELLLKGEKEMVDRLVKKYPELGRYAESL
jgi:hypothetical protein